MLDGGGASLETRDYYPFGLPMPVRYEKGSPPTQEDYTGHVKDGETGLHYAGARYYSSAFGIWNAADPYADKFPTLSPYNYGANNPLLYIDPHGLWIQKTDEDGNVTFVAEEGDNFETFMDQYGLSKEKAKKWFKEHGMSEYLPQEKEAGGLLGLLGVEKTVYPTVGKGTSFQSEMGHLKLSVENIRESGGLLSGISSEAKQDLVNQLTFAVASIVLCNVAGGLAGTTVE